MSIAGILNNSPFNFTPPTLTSSQPTFQKELQQLGQDLQAGNLSAAQSDFATLQQNSPTAAASSSTSIAQAFSQLGKDLQSGNLSAAQQDFSTIHQDAQSHAAHGHHHHHHGGGGAGSSQNTLSQELALLGQDLQAGNLSAAQQAYNTVQQAFQAFGANPVSTPVQLSA